MKTLAQVREEHLEQARRALRGLPVPGRLLASPAFRALMEKMRAGGTGS